MNLVSTMVTLSIAGASAPAISQMAVAPYVAQVQSENFTQAESLAVTIAAQAEGTGSLPSIPNGCSVASPVGSVYQVTCNAGAGRYGAQATRSFRILAQVPNGGAGAREFDYERPEKYSGHQCPTHDPWGVNGYNDDWASLVGGACKPNDVWNRNNYLASDPDAWLYDVNNFNGWGHHEGY